ncbi:MAG: PaaI family thioesterase [Hyphomonadaceae bacterium]
MTGFELAMAIKERRLGAPPPWVEHMRVLEENPIQVLEVGRVVTAWRPGPQFTVRDGYVQGGLLAALADGGQYLALLSTLETPESWVTIDLHTRFVRPIKQHEAVTIESRVLSRTATSAIVETTFTLAGERLAAKVTGGWRASPTRPVPGTPA